MGYVDTAEAGRDFRQFDDLVRWRETIGHVLKRRAQSESPIFHRLGHQLLHRGHLVRTGWAGVSADHIVPHTAGTHEATDIDRGMRPRLEPYKILAKRSPVRHDAELTERSLAVTEAAVSDDPITERTDRGTLTGDLRGDTL